MPILKAYTMSAGLTHLFVVRDDGSVSRVLLLSTLQLASAHLFQLQEQHADTMKLNFYHLNWYNCHNKVLTTKQGKGLAKLLYVPDRFNIDKQKKSELCRQ